MRSTRPVVPAIAILAVVVVGTVLLVSGTTTVQPSTGATPRPHVARLPPPSPSLKLTAPPPPMSSGRADFASIVHGYTLTLPDGWTAWSSPTSVGNDLLLGPEGQIVVARTELADAVAADDWTGIDPPVSTHRCHLADPETVHVGDDGFPFEGLPLAWADVSVGDRRARIREYCDHVEAMVWASRYGYHLSLRNEPRSSARATLHSLLDGFRPRGRPMIEPSAPPAPTPTPKRNDTTTFRSAAYGYTIGYPTGWRAIPTPDELGDTFHSTKGAVLRIWSRPREPGVTALEWADLNMPEHTKNVPVRHCEWSGGGGSIQWFEGLPSSEFVQDVVAGRRTITRSACGWFEAIYELPRSVLIVSLRSNRRIPTGDRETFEAFAETLTLPGD